MIVAACDRRPPGPGDVAAIDADALRRATAAEAHATWGCPAARGTPPVVLSDDEGFASLARGAHRVMGTTPTGTCPFACLFTPAPYAEKVFRALRLAERGVPVEKSLGRAKGLLPGDLRALDAFEVARLHAEESDQAEMERERQAPPGKEPP